jgi:hypothetical protein
VSKKYLANSGENSVLKRVIFPNIPLRIKTKFFISVLDAAELCCRLRQLN